MKNKATEVLYGIHPVAEALRSGRRTIHEIVIQAGSENRLEMLTGLVLEKGLAIKTASKDTLRSITRTHMHQGVAARVSPYPVIAFQDIIQNMEKTKPCVVLLLDNVVDPHNLGALVRTALCSGVHWVLITKDRSASPTPTVSKASAGALEHMALAIVTNMAVTIQELKKHGVWIVGLEKDSVDSIYNTDLTDSIGIVIGGEEKGIRPLVKKQCDFMFSIPQMGPVNSLNASVAGGVVMYEVLRQRLRLSVPV